MKTFKIKITIKECIHLECTPNSINFISFSGICDNEYFKGITLDNSVDTQIIGPDGKTTLSARYILSGTDLTGKKANIFIENNGYIDESGIIKTTPKIITDSNALKWLEYEIKSGTLETIGDELYVILRG